MTELINGWLKPEWKAPSSVHTLISSRVGGVSSSPYDSLNLGDHVGDLPANVLANRALLKKQLPTEPLWLKQVHGTSVSTPEARLFEADAIVTDVVNEVLVIMSADCLPVLFTNQAGTVIGAAHAGWRGLCAGILESTIREMRNLCKHPAGDDIIAWLGPAIGPQAFEVGQDVVDTFNGVGIAYPPAAFISIPGNPGKYLADIYLLARSRLITLGIDQIYGGQYCTVTQADQFFSYRRDGRTGRFASLIWISESK